MHKPDGNDKICKMWQALNVQHGAAAADWVARLDI